MEKIQLNMRGKAVKAAKTRGIAHSRALTLLGCTLFGVIAAPALGSAFSVGLAPAPVSLSARGGLGSFTPASVDPRLAAQIGSRATRNGRLFRFTPAGMENRPDRAITVAVRVNDFGSQNLAVRSPQPAGANTGGTAPIRIAPMVYNLGLARGYESFAATAGAPRESAKLDVQRLDMPDLRAIGSKGNLATSSAAAPTRLAPRIELETRERAGRAPHTFEGQGDYQVDLGGSYRLSRNFDVTAGVRYSPERDRLRPLTNRKKDNQAVYVGTQFRF